MKSKNVAQHRATPTLKAMPHICALRAEARLTEARLSEAPWGIPCAGEASAQVHVRLRQEARHLKFLYLREKYHLSCHCQTIKIIMNNYYFKYK